MQKRRNNFFNKASLTSCLIVGTLTLICTIATIFIENPNWKNFFISFTATLIGLIISIIAIQLILDKQVDKNKKKKETIAIKNFNKLFFLYLEDYIFNFNSLVTPLTNLNERFGITFKTKFNLSDMKDMYLSQGNLLKNFSESCISLFFKSQKELIEYMKVMLQTISFDFYPELNNIMISFIQEDLKVNVKDFILQFDTFYKDNKKMPKYIADMIKDYNGIPEKDIQSNKYNSNILLPYLYLYQTMKTQIALLDNFKAFCKNNDLIY